MKVKPCDQYTMTIEKKNIMNIEQQMSSLNKNILKIASLSLICLNKLRITASFLFFSCFNIGHMYKMRNREISRV